MAIKTLAGITAGSGGQAGSNGLYAFTAAAPGASNMNAVGADLQSAAKYSDLAGVLEGGVCTATLLDVTIPEDTIYFAQAVLRFDADYVQAVPNNDETWIWACADGRVRITEDADPPVGYDARTACLLTKATASAGTATVDNDVQWLPRYADADARQVNEGGALTVDYDTLETTAHGDLTSAGLVSGVLAVQKNAVGSGVEITIESDETGVYYGTLTGNGVLTGNGRLRGDEF